MFVSSYFSTAAAIILNYDGGEPFHHFIKKYFSQNKKFGSRDRKQISQLCYSFFRLGKAIPALSIEARLIIALFLCSPPNVLLAQKKAEWNILADHTITDKLKAVQQEYAFQVEDIFPFKEALSQEIDHALFCNSFLIQPDVYLRIRPGKENIVQKKLTAALFQYQLPAPDCIALPNASKVDMVLNIDEEVVVQDKNSQRVLQPLQEYAGTDIIKTAWDCCAASGGKSLLLKDTFPHIDLTVSDIRKNILTNLRNRFQKAGIKNYHSFTADIAAFDFQLHQSFDLIICDAPCTGSGTWSRTPEQLFFFKEEKIQYYAALQKRILANAVKYLNKNGWLLYITCSVFTAENEAIVTFIQQQLSLRLQHQQYFKGYDQKADTLFAALFRIL